ncbi:aldo/keto reductase family protein [Bacillus altitudinis]|uniref:aldo/keto reductase family protein n=1 Tax=Bacillus altitudinis TaxID=293387 RepID=UPI0015BFF67F|nr:aldo/keto reductase family protein [Bacillus altitudinis]MCM3045457.1 aldo/keto reductase family protein [Bacillus altitudinis]MEC1802124.1 aldo/keto reductase family protein [Bacillus altitudinis]
MKYSKLGNSGLTISKLAYGNWINHGGKINEDTAHDCVKAALDVGITTFDTADVYSDTKAEEILGRSLKGIRRESIELCTKVCHPTGTGKNDRGLSRKHIMENCHASLRRLQTDYIDIYYAHRFDPTTPLEETMLAFADLVRQGKVNYIGVSEWTAEQITRGAVLARELNVPLIASQPQYSMLWRIIESDVIPTCQREGLGQVVWSPLAQGILTGKYLPGKSLPTNSRANSTAGKPFFQNLAQRWMNNNTLEAIQKLKLVAQEVDLTLAQLAIAWVLQNQNVSAAIIGASSPEQVRENALASEVKIEAELMNQIDEILGDLVEYDQSKTG